MRSPLLLLAAALLLAGQARALHAPNAPNAKCGYGSCHRPRPGAVNVHLVPHTHDDVGWLKTVDQYYYGQRTSIQRAGVQYILNTVVDELWKDPQRRFIYVESEFFHQWWAEQTGEKRRQVRQLVNEGRLEFIGGGWSMNDEAAAHYVSTIDQMTLGHRFLRAEFGRCAIPRVAWQIDPFGHSREQAALFAQMGFDGLFFGRLDWEEKQARERNLSMEMVWAASRSLGAAAGLFTGALPNGYNPPAGFCFDDTCDDQPIVDDPHSADYNVPEKVQLFLETVRNQSRSYASRQLIMTMGSDFQYQNANPWFVNLDKLIRLVNGAQDKVHLLYSTPSCYLKALNDERLKWPVKRDDFFPYSSDPHAFWAGYFTSRPSFKRHEREASSTLQVCKQLQVFANLSDDASLVQLAQLADAVAISQHHDAITGTEKQHVFADYVRRLAAAERGCAELIVRGLQKLESGRRVRDDDPTEPSQQPRWDTASLSHCPLLNISQCDVTEQLDVFYAKAQVMPIVAYNQHAASRHVQLRIPLHRPDAGRLSLTNSSGLPVRFSLEPIPVHIQQLPERRSNATHLLVFAARLPPLGYASFSLTTKATRRWTAPKRTVEKQPGQTPIPTSLQGLDFTLDLHPNTSLPVSITRGGQTTPFEHLLRWYPAMAGDNGRFERRASGAYIFRPNATESKPLTQEAPKVTYAKYDGYETLQVVYTGFAAETIRVYRHLDHIEFDYLVGPLPAHDFVGKELVADYRAAIENEGHFETDANGRQQVRRQRNHRDTYEYDATMEPVASNYYPVNARISIKHQHQDLELSVLVDRSAGGASLRDGQLEVMLHRRLLFDDAFGVGEALNEPGNDGAGLVVRGRQLVHMGQRSAALAFRRHAALDLALTPFVVFGQPQVVSRLHNQPTPELAPEPLLPLYRSALGRAVRLTGLPPAVHLLTVESFRAGRVLLRLEHIFEAGEMPAAVPVRVDLRTLLDERLVGKMAGAVEMSLSANQVKGSVKRLQWSTQEPVADDGAGPEPALARDEDDWRRKLHYLEQRSDEFETELAAVECGRWAPTDFVVTLQPFAIRTFLVRFRRPGQLDDYCA